MSAEDRFSVENRSVIITGAGRGIGRQTALAFAKSGSIVAVASRTLEEVEAVISEIRNSGGEAYGFQVDITSEKSVGRLFDKAIEQIGRIDVLVNNAGIYINRPALETSQSEWDLMIDTNMKGMFFCSCQAAREMAPGGRIITISSILSTVAQHGYASYGASKAGVEQLTRVLALEWAASGITVNAVAPTSTITRETLEQLSTPKALENARNRIPLGRYCDVEDVIGAILYLSSDAAKFITGQTLYIDGGLSLQ